MVIAPMAWFEVKSPKRVAKIRLDANFFVIGRGERIPIFHDDPSISREHAAVVIPRSGAIRVRDLGSKNGVLLNGKTIGRYAEKDVAVGDTLTIGATTLLLHEGEPPAKIAATIAVPVKTPASEADGTGRAKTGEAAATADALRVEAKPEAEPLEPPTGFLTPARPPIDTAGAREAAGVSSAPTALEELATDLVNDRDGVKSVPAPRSAAESAAAAAASAAAAAASAALAANAAAQAASGGSADGEVQDLSEIADKGEAPPELLASDEDEFPELA